MIRKWLIVMGAFLLCVTIAGWATPPAGILFNIILSQGTSSDDLNEKVRIDDWKVDLDTKGESDFYMQDVALAPGGYSGWETHPVTFFVF